MLTEAKDFLGFALMMDCPGDYELWLRLTSGIGDEAAIHGAHFHGHMELLTL